MRIPAVVNSVTGLGYLFSTDGVSARTIQAMIGLVFRYCSARDRVVTIFQNTDDMALFVEKRWAKRDQAVLIRGSGVDLKVFPYHELADASRPLVLFPSRLLMHKGISEFVGAAQRLKNDFPNVSFAVAGDLDPDNPASLSEETLRRWTEQGNVEFWGYCDNMSTAYGQATIVCLPSYYREGVPKALIEAAATGRAIVTTNMPGCRELVVDGVNGLLVPPRDIDALTSALRALLNDLPRCREMGAEGRRVVEAGYSLSDVTTHTVALYERLLGSEKAGDNQHPVG
jgi:glycosyltransferase involved in cell wall biosynthesis